jgi:LysM repeat protein
MEETRRAPSDIKRCPACGSRVASDAAICDTCGHQFGETGAIPLAEIEKAYERERQRISSRTPQTPRTARPGAPRTPASRARPRIPWGVISVVVITAALLGGGYWLLQRVAVVEVDATATPVGVALIGTPTPAFQLAELAPPTASPTEFVQPTRTPVPPTKYTVVSGDTCGGIAKALGVPYSEFLRVNQLNDDSCSNLQIGDEVIVPAATPTPGPTETLAPDYTPPPPPQAAAGGTYVVKQGDSCSVIAAQFNLSIDDLIRINPDLNLNQQCLIQVGDTLNVSGATIATSAPATPYLIIAPTARESYPPPQLISPVDNAQIEDPALLLEWLSVGILRPNEVYVVQIQPAGAITVPVFETRGTSLRISSDLLEGQPERAIAWWVQVRQRIGEQNGLPIYREAGPPSAARRFIWRKLNAIQLGTPTP